MDTVELDDEPDPGRSWLFALAAVVAATAVVVAVLIVVDAFGDDDDASSPSTTQAATQPSASTSAPTSTAAPATTVPATNAPTTTAPAATAPATTAPATTAPATTAPATTAPPVEQVRGAIFPTPGMETSYTDPEIAAREFAVAVGYADPVAGDFRAGDSRSGEVEIRAAAGSPPSIVFVRQLDDRGGWYVIGAATENVVVDTPDALDVLTSPLEVAGSALAFEGTVEVLLTADDVEDPLVESFVTGSGGPEPGPFEGSFEFDPPDAEGGALLFLSRSSEDGSVLEVSALRVFFHDEG